MALSGYRLMWMMVLFDLPVLTKKERKAATKFRKFLLDQGFEMSQFSVYLRFCAGKEQAETYTKRVSKNTPETGKATSSISPTSSTRTSSASMGGNVNPPARIPISSCCSDPRGAASGSPADRKNPLSPGGYAKVEFSR